MICETKNSPTYKYDFEYDLRFNAPPMSFTQVVTRFAELNAIAKKTASKYIGGEGYLLAYKKIVTDSTLGDPDSSEYDRAEIAKRWADKSGLRYTPSHDASSGLYRLMSKDVRKANRFFDSRDVRDALSDIPINPPGVWTDSFIDHPLTFSMNLDTNRFGVYHLSPYIEWWSDETLAIANWFRNLGFDIRIGHPSDVIRGFHMHSPNIRPTLPVVIYHPFYTKTLANW